MCLGLERGLDMNECLGLEHGPDLDECVLDCSVDLIEDGHVLDWNMDFLG